MKNGNICDTCKHRKYEEKTKFSFFKLCLCIATAVLLYSIFVWLYGWAVLKYAPITIFKGVVGGIVTLNSGAAIINKFDWDTAFN